MNINARFFQFEDKSFHQNLHGVEHGRRFSQFLSAFFLRDLHF